MSPDSLDYSGFFEEREREEREREKRETES